MCESCGGEGFGRREFLALGGAMGASVLLSGLRAGPAGAAEVVMPPLAKKPARVLAAYLYPPADVVNEGRMEDSWAPHKWFTWPGNQFQPEAQEQKFTAKIREMGQALGIEIEFAPRAIYQQAKVDEFIAYAQRTAPDAVLVINFWNTLSNWAFRMATESAPTAIVYHSLGSNHQLPPEALRKADGLYYIHSMENFDEIERGLRAVRARKMMAQSRLLRVSGKPTEVTQGREEKLEMEIVDVPAGELNAMFDAVVPDEALQKEAAEFKKGALWVTDVTDEYLVEAMRAHRAVRQIIDRYSADAITIECLMLQHRKPCLSFAINNGNLLPSGCENHLDATLTLMLGRWLLDRGGFQHNPEFDTSENRYFGAHCTCALKLHGPAGPSQPYAVRPFFHQLPKTAALDVQWTPGEPILVAKYQSGLDKLACWQGKVIESPASPPTGGCATRVLMEIEGVKDVCDIYAGAHPVLFCGDRGDARRMKAFAKMYRLQLDGNV
ncbi:MAG: hypothetical protein ACYC6Y_09455 [Thermoguttaceae bacterium]